MADDVDLTQEREDFLLAHRIARVREAVARPISYPAECLWCKAPTGGISFYCSAECREDHEQHKRFRGVRP
jgi:hypothetical protein